MAEGQERPGRVSLLACGSIGSEVSDSPRLPRDGGQRSDITADVRLQTNEREHTKEHVEGVVTATGPLPDLALAVLAASAGHRGT